MRKISMYSYDFSRSSKARSGLRVGPTLNSAKLIGESWWKNEGPLEKFHGNPEIAVGELGGEYTNSLLKARIGASPETKCKHSKNGFAIALNLYLGARLL